MTKHGFTLLETAIVICIVGVLISIAVPHFISARDRGATRAALTELGAAFAMARRSALLERSPVTVAFDTAFGIVNVRDRERVLFTRSLSAGYGVKLRTTRDSAVYDARGLGFGLSNLTVTVRRGRIVDTLTMSRLGRVKW